MSGLMEMVILKRGQEKSLKKTNIGKQNNRGSRTPGRNKKRRRRRSELELRLQMNG